MEESGTFTYSGIKTGKRETVQHHNISHTRKPFIPLQQRIKTNTNGRDKIFQGHSNYPIILHGKELIQFDLGYEKFLY